MSWRGQIRGVLGLAIGLFLSTAGTTRAQEKGSFQPSSTKVAISTADFVELRGRFYRAAGQRQDACVLLLQDPQEQHALEKEAWEDFAGSLQQAGFDVLSFDFRGRGGSTNVDPEFWNRARFPYNQLIRGAARKPAMIHFKDFSSGYLPYLVNDVAAARAFLDICNDQGEVNTSNLILIGAGEGATLGLLWMAAECRLQRDAISRQPFRVRHVLHEPQGSDLACGIWLDIRSTLAGRRFPLERMLRDVAGKGKVRTVLLCREGASKTLEDTVEKINRGQKNRMAHLRSLGTARSRRLGTLLGKGGEAAGWVLEDCLPNVLEVRGLHNERKREAEKDAFVWTFPWPREPGAQAVVAKRAGERTVHPLPVHLLLGP